MAPPLFSTLSAVTELLVTAAVFWFFQQALVHGRYRFGIMAVALVYETLFNITYMTARFFGEGTTGDHEAWFSVLLAVHGTLSLLMFIGLIVLVIWAFDRRGKGDLDPLGTRRKLAWTFLVLWTLSVLSGEFIYVMQWTGAEV